MSIIVKIIIASLLLFGVSIPSFAWEGYDYSNNNYVEIGKNNTVRRGKDIEIYDYNSRKYRDASVESVRQYGNRVEVEVYDHDNHQYRTLEMDR